MRFDWVVSASALALTGAACADGSSEWAGTVVDSAGVTVVSNPAQPIWGEGEGWTVEQQLKIGTAEGDPDYEFGQISSIGVGSDGRIYVLDQQAQEVKVFTPDGAFLNTIGAAGSGPGEIGAGAAAVMLGREDSIFVADLGNQRVNRFWHDGRSLGSFPMPLAEGVPISWIRGPGGTLVYQLRVFQLPGQPETDRMDRIIRRGGDGSVIDTILEFPQGRTFDFSSGAPRTTLFETEPIWTATTGGRIFLGKNDSYEIKAFSREGELDLIMRKPFERQPVTERDQEIFLDAIANLIRAQGAPPQAAEAFMSGVSFNDYYPAFVQLRAGPQASLLVQHVRTAESVAEEGTFNPQDVGSPDWDVFDHEGKYLGVLQMPERFNPLLIEEDNVFGVWRDELDVQYVMWLTIEGADAETL